VGLSCACMNVLLVCSPVQHNVFLTNDARWEAFLDFPQCSFINALKLSRCRIESSILGMWVTANGAGLHTFLMKLMWKGCSPGWGGCCFSFVTWGHIEAWLVCSAQKWKTHLWNNFLFINFYRVSNIFSLFCVQVIWLVFRASAVVYIVCIIQFGRYSFITFLYILK